MQRQETRIGLGIVLVLGALIGLSEWAGAKDDAPGASMPTQKRVDHPFVKDLVGRWEWTSKNAAGVEEKGAESFRLGLLETAVLDDLEGTAGGQAFEGHGVWKVSEDGASVSAWWFFSVNAGPREFRGALTADGYDVKSDDGERMTLKKTTTGLEMRAWKDGKPTRTVTFTKR